MFSLKTMLILVVPQTSLDGSLRFWCGVETNREEMGWHTGTKRKRRCTQSAAIVTAIVIGDRAGLDDEVQRRLQEAGTYHVIAISGGNIAILAGLTLVVFRVAGLLGRAAMHRPTRRCATSS